MYTIGQFSKICKVTTKALRHYEKIGLLVPTKVDPSNGYRYYSREQVSIMKQISLMRELDIPLQKIKQMIEKAANREELRSLLEEHRKHLLKQLDLYNSRLVKLAWWQKTLEANEMTEMIKYDVRIREVLETRVRALRKQVTSFPEEIPSLLRSLLEEIESSGEVCAGPPIILYHDEEFNPGKVDLEVAWPVMNSSLANKTLPAVRAAACMHVGPYDGLEHAYEAVFAWVNQNGYRAVPPYREISYNDPQTTPPEQLVTEIIIPVVKT